MAESTVVAPGPPSGSGPAPGSDQSSDRLAALWRVLTEPWLVLVLAAAMALLLAGGFVLPQMPGQLQDEAGATVRWLSDVSEAYGPLGTLLRGLGLFDVVHSPLFRLVAASLVFVLLLQAAHLMLVALCLRRLPALLDAEGVRGGEPLPVSAPYAMHRWRVAYPRPPLVALDEVRNLLARWFPRIDRRTVRVRPMPLPAASESSHGDHETSPEGLVLEERLLGVSSAQGALLRPLLPVGMLFALAVIWLQVTAGWQFTPEPLIPGDRTSDSEHNITFEYRLEQPSARVIGPGLQIAANGNSLLLPLSEEMRTTIGNITVQGRPGPPALVVRTVDDAPLLARPGQSTAATLISLGFPTPSSEETLLLPQMGIGLRVVRLDEGTPTDADDAFLVEVYQTGSEEPVQHIRVSDSQVELVGSGFSQVPLAFVPLPMLRVQAYRAPTLWLLWPALVLVLAGLFGYRHRPGFALVQAGPWPEERTVLIVQTDLAAAMAAIENRRQVLMDQAAETAAAHRLR